MTSQPLGQTREKTAEFLKLRVEKKKVADHPILKMANYSKKLN